MMKNNVVYLKNPIIKEENFFEDKEKFKDKNGNPTFGGARVMQELRYDGGKESHDNIMREQGALDMFNKFQYFTDHYEEIVSVIENKIVAVRRI